MQGFILGYAIVFAVMSRSDLQVCVAAIPFNAEVIGQL
jgi:hypothetical protein